jgi:hypothetical protein
MTVIGHLATYDPSTRDALRQRYPLTNPPPAAPPVHDADCERWCNHCDVCGVGMLYGRRCPDHPAFGDPNARCGGVSVNGADPACCEVHLLPWGHKRDRRRVPAHLDKSDAPD